jgi:hypothetical protein
MLAALILGLKRQSGRWRETLHCAIMEQFCLRAIFPIQFGILLARVDEVIEWIGRLLRCTSVSRGSNATG